MPPNPVPQDEKEFIQELFKDVRTTAKGELVCSRVNIVKYIDACILVNRLKRDKLPDTDLDKVALVGAIDALQAFRASLIGETLPL